MSEMNGGAGDGAVVFDITARTEGFENALSTITRQLTTAAAGWDELAFRFATKLGLAISDAISAAVDEGVDLASSLEEISNRINVAFGEEGAKKIDDWSKTVHDKFGLTELQAKNYVSLLGAQFAATGMDKNTALDYAIQMAERVADIASLYDVDFDTVFRKVRSGISGIARPMYDYGVDLTKNTVSSAYSENNPEDGRKWDELSEWEQEIARMEELFRQTEYLVGDFERTQGSYANLGRRAENAWNAFLTNLGKFFLPLRTNQRKVGVGLLESLAYGPSAERLLGPLASIVSSSTSSQMLTSVFGTSTDSLIAGTGEYAAQKRRSDLMDLYGVMADEGNTQGLSEAANLYLNELQNQIDLGLSKGIGMDKYQKNLDFYRGENLSDYGSGELYLLLDHLSTLLTQAYEQTGTSDENQIFIPLYEAITSVSSNIDNAGSSAASSITSAGSNVSSALNGVASSISSVSFNPFGWLFSGLLGKSHANGLDNVPYDGYMAILHQGERVQTAAEASLSRRYSMAQPQTFDYGAMGSAIGAHLPQGGNMQIVWRGRVVADVLSEMQGDSYRALERSGWRT